MNKEFIKQQKQIKSYYKKSWIWSTVAVVCFTVCCILVLPKLVINSTSKLAETGLTKSQQWSEENSNKGKNLNQQLNHQWKQGITPVKHQTSELDDWQNINQLK